MALHVLQEHLELLGVRDRVVGYKKTPLLDLGHDLLEIGEVLAAVGVQEREVERPGERHQARERLALLDLNVPGNACLGEVLPRYRDLRRRSLERDDEAAGTERR